jgi:uncharacterized protein YjbI with pentapeptide repeats
MKGYSRQNSSLTLLILFVIPFICGSSQSLNPVPSNDIETQIHGNEPIKNVIIEGNLSLIDEILPSITITDSVVNGSLDFFNVTVLGKADFHNTTFKNYAFFRKSQFKGRSSFNNSVFEDRADFRGSQFNAIADFYKAKFETIASLNECKFGGDAAFLATQFNGTSFFQYSIFAGDLTIDHSEFNDTCDFTFCEFKRKASIKRSNMSDSRFAGSTFNSTVFSRLQFNGSAELYSSNFLGEASFTNCQFIKNADFSESQFRKDADFDGSTFERASNFEKSKFYGFAYFEDASFNGDALFTKTQFDDAFFENTSIQNLSLNGAKYDRFYIRWFNIKRLYYDETAYKLLINNFKNLGLMDDANECYLDFMMQYTLAKQQPFERIFLIFSYLLYGFGTRPQNAILWSIIIIIVLGLFWRALGRIHLNKNTDEYSYVWEPNPFHSLSGAMIFSLRVFAFGYGISFLSQIFLDPPIIPEELDKQTVWAKRTYYLERLLGAFLSFLFVIALSKTI